MRKLLLLFSAILILAFVAAEPVPALIMPPGGTNPDSTIVGLIQQINQDSIKSYMLKLESYNDRLYSLPNRDTIAAWLSDKFRSFGFTEVKADSHLYNGIWIKNIIASVPGNSADSKIIIAGAHYDTRYNPGADDNASGSAAVLEMARVLKKSGLTTDYAFSFMLFAAEENGMIGSKNLVNKYKAENRKIALMINLDMISYSSDTNKYVMIHKYPGFEQYQNKAAQITQKFTDLKVPVISYSPSSDNYYFGLNGYPAVYFAEYERNPRYHSKSDSVVYCNIGYASKITKAALAVMYSFSFLPESPSIASAVNLGDGSRLRLKWSRSRGAGAVSYKVGIGRTEYLYDSEFYTSDTTAVIDNLYEGTTFHFGISAVDAAYSESMIKNVSLTVSKLPAPPLNLADAPDKDRIVLSWNRNTEEDLAGYNVYRSADSLNFTKLNEIPVPDTLYADKSVFDDSFYYYVTGIDKDGNEGFKSQAVLSHAVTMTHGILVLDGSDELGSVAFSFKDAQIDSCYESLIPGCTITSIDLKKAKSVKLSELGRYSAVIWHNETMKPLVMNTEPLQRYLDFGGSFIYTGFNIQCLNNVSELKYSYDFSAGDFIYKYLRIKSILSSSNSLTAVGAYPALPEYEHIYTDNKKFPSWSVSGVQALVPAVGGTVNFTYQPEHAWTVRDKPAGVEYMGRDYKTFVLSFPLFYLDPQIAQRLVNIVLRDKFNVITGTEGNNSDIPAGFSLNQNYPNPFNPATVISYSVPHPAEVIIKVFDVLGKEVAVLENAFRKAGKYEIRFDASHLPSGVFIYTLKAGNFRQSRKLLLLK